MITLWWVGHLTIEWYNTLRFNLTTKQIDSYGENGFVVIKNFLSLRELET